MLTVRSTINIASQTVPPIIPVVQGDTGRAILFTLADFTIPAGATATYYVQKPSGEAVYNNATIDGNNVLVELTAQSIIEKGDNYGQVRITVGEEVVTSFDFILLVKEFRGIDAVQSLTEMNIFDKAVEQASEAIDEVKTDALEAIDDAKDEAIEEVTSNFDLKLDASSTKGVQNQVITQAINTVNNAIGDLSGETVTPTATNNYGVGGNVGQVIETWATTEYWHGIYTVSAGNTYGITTVSDFPQQIVVWFTNSSNVILEIHKAFATDHVEMVCTAPTGATKLFVMSYGYDAYHGTVQKVEPLSETVSNLKEDYSKKINLSFVNVFDDASSFEYDGDYWYIWWASQFHFRGVPKRNQDISISDARTSVGSDYVKTSPSGKTSIALPKASWLVYDLNTSGIKVINRSTFNYNTHILLFAAPYGIPSGGAMYYQYVKNLIDKTSNTIDNKDRVTLLNARHIATDSDSPLTILQLSDLHADSASMKRIMDDASKYNNVDAYICTGDMAANTYGQISEWWDSRIMTCIGNHDTASYSNEAYNWTALSMADRDAYYIAPFESNWGIIHTSGTSYYYKDFATQKIRLIVMDTMLYTGTPGSEATAQTAWLANLLSDAITNNLHVLIAIHSPHGGAVAKECSFSRYGQGTMPTWTDCNTPQTVIDTVADAITNGLHFIGYIVGHTHQDNIWDAEGDGKQLMYCITCGSVSKPQWINSDQYRSETADAYNLISIDTAHTLVKIIRGGGANIDDHMRTRKAICFNYSTGQIVGEVL